MKKFAREDAVPIALVVAEDREVCALLQHAVAAHGYATTICNTAASGLEVLVGTPPQLIILDWLLPDMPGLELLRIIGAAGQSKYQTVLALFPRDNPEEANQAIAAGADYFLSKPLEKKALDVWLAAATRQVGLRRQKARDDLAMAKIREELDDNNMQLEEALSRANSLAMEAEQAYIEISQIFKTVAGGITLVDTNCNILRCNDSFLTMTGLTREESHKTKYHDLFHAGLCETGGCPMQRVKNGEKRIETQVERPGPSGEALHYNIVTTPFKGPAGDLVGIVEHITDITDRVKAELALAESERRYRELSTVDELTGLFNKRYFNKHMALEVERAKRHRHSLCLLLFDIDNFKHHNDTYGHADGDLVLARLGKVIAGAVRINDIPCRYGGEEFTIILPEINGDQAIVVAERIRARFAAEVFEPNPGERVSKTVSIGIAQYRLGENGQSLLERADHNMYQAKQTGKDRVVFQ